MTEAQAMENHNILLVGRSFNWGSDRFYFIEIVHQIHIKSFRLKIRFDTGEQLIRSSRTLTITAIYGTPNFLAFEN